MFAATRAFSCPLVRRSALSMLRGPTRPLFLSMGNARPYSKEKALPVHTHVSAKAHVQSMQDYDQLYTHSIESPDQFWHEMAESLVDFKEPYKTVHEGSLQEANSKWFVGGKLNACWNAVDRHALSHPDKVAIIWEADEPGTGRKITYQQLQEDVSRVANVLKANGARKGDVVCIYMPMMPEAAVAMLACARLGCIHSVVFAGFSTQAVRDRIQDAKSRFVITSNEGLRAGKHIPLKKTVDEAVDGLDVVEKVFVFPRTDVNVPMKEGRDIDMRAAAAAAYPVCDVVWQDSEDPLFVLYTSGSTGKPKGLVHSTGGYLVTAACTHRFVFDYHPGDVYACVADIGWITGHTYIVYGPLVNGATTVMFESLPTYPDSSRYWKLIEDYKVNSFYTSPTAIRSLMKAGVPNGKDFDISSLKVLGTVGEPINPEAWNWFYEHIGQKRCSIVDTYWQTETGGITLTPLPGATPMKPGSATFPFFGMKHSVLDATTGDHVSPGKDGKKSGLLCFSQPWPGMARTILNDHDRFKATYLSAYPGHYFTGDSCNVDQDGYVWITGRVDDVINKAGHRMSSSELENVLLQSDGCAECAVISVPDDVKGEAIWAFCCPMAGKTLAVDTLKLAVRKSIGPIAVPDAVVIVRSLPKTRSGKVMRRLLRSIIMGGDVGDTTTLADQEVLPILEDGIKAVRGH